ncbi:ATP-binding response regulator [Chitinophaga qingshengii]|uniref:histidine kinase n=1 Tax=Chitinophaga qingshengii TaxID=1569794 RepID=A0ABR7TLW7_9BACT|nr:hybrid sensor histidine kinase/response regulator [Chitinophaga qingshengii]MBC9931490.1 hybrid sensor histidine kinase/response regulator [Chitinophaga qingshengii]
MLTTTTLKTTRSWIDKFCRIGTDNPLLDQDARRKIYIVNLIGAITVLMNFIPGLIILSLTHSLRIYIPSTAEGLLFMLVPYLNYKHRYNAAVMLMFGAHMASFLYFGLLFGPAVNVSAIATFLIGSVVLLYNSERYIITSIILAVVAILILQVDYFYQFVPPLTLSEYQLSVINKLAAMIVFLLNCITLYCYITALLKQRKRQEQIIAEKTAQLSTACNFLEEFVHTNWHDLRQGVNNLVLSNKDLLNTQQEQGFPDVVRVPAEQLSNLAIVSWNLDQQVSNALDFSLLRKGQLPEKNLEIITVRQWAEEIVRFNSMSSKRKNVMLQLSIQADIPPRIVTDVRRTTRIVNNLLSNAIKFTAVGTAVELEIGLDANKRHFTIRVSDQGPGIEADQLEQIFLPFTTTYNAFQPGYGIGLPNARVLAKSLGGNIQVDSVPGKGATFTFRHPVFKLGEQETAPVEQQQADFGGARVLFIDDNEMYHKLFRQRLKETGCEMHSEFTGAKGLEAARTFPLPDLILLDLTLPDIHGMEVLKKLKKEYATRHIPVIIASTVEEAGLKERVLQAGADGFIRKELTTDNIGAELQKFLSFNVATGS